MKSKIEIIIPCLGLLCLAIFITHTTIRDDKQMEESNAYSICKIEKRELGLLKQWVYFKYLHLDNNELHSDQLGSDYELKMIKAYDKFIVKFSTDNLSNFIVLYDYPVMNDSLLVPETGWTLIPDWESLARQGAELTWRDKIKE